MLTITLVSIVLKLGIVAVYLSACIEAKRAGKRRHALELLLLALLYLSLLATETVKHEMVAAGAGLDVVRLLIGLETGDDIIADLDQALKAAA
jgi:hypothetical protein